VIVSDEVFENCLSRCKQAAVVYFNTEAELVKEKFISPSNSTLPSLEKAMLDMVAYRVTQGVFYCLTLQFREHTVMRYIETGCYRGFLPTSTLITCQGCMELSKTISVVCKSLQSRTSLTAPACFKRAVCRFLKVDAVTRVNCNV
jgi:hypothetical protein